MKILLSTRTHSPAAFQDLAQELGFDGIEVVMPSRRLNEPFSRDWSLEGVKRATAVHAPVGCMDMVSYQQALQDALGVAKQLQAKVINIHPPSSAEKFGGRQNILNGIQAIQAAGQGSNQLICYEITPQSHRNKLLDEDEKSYEGVQAWCDDIAKFNIPATLDTTHIASWGEDPSVYVSTLGANLRHIHVSDYSSDGQHLFPGEGDINWPTFFTAVKKLTHIGEITVSIEPGARFDLFEVDKPRLQKSLELIQQLVLSS